MFKMNAQNASLWKIVWKNHQKVKLLFPKKKNLAKNFQMVLGGRGVEGTSTLFQDLCSTGKY